MVFRYSVFSYIYLTNVTNTSTLSVTFTIYRLSLCFKGSTLEEGEGLGIN